MRASQVIHAEMALKGAGKTLAWKELEGPPRDLGRFLIELGRPPRELGGPQRELGLQRQYGGPLRELGGPRP